MPLSRSLEIGYNTAMPDELEARMKFIIEQQAKFEVDVQMLKERQEEALRIVEGHSRQLEVHAGMIRQLIDVNLSLTHHMERLAEAQTNTEYKLNALVDTVDKIVRHNGGAA